MISLSKSKTVEIDSGFSLTKFGAIAASLLCGVWFSVRSFEIHHTLTTTKLDAIQLTVDAMLISAFMYLPCFIWVCVNGHGYDLSDILTANTMQVLNYVGTIAVSGALKFGKAGHVLAVENLKVVWQVTLLILIQGSLPNVMEVIGCSLGMMGVACIVFSKK